MVMMARIITENAGSPRLLGVTKKHRDVACTVALVLLIAASRIIVFPASLWEQDEAYFAAAVIQIDVGDSQPHPPFFPLWIGLGKVVHRVGMPAAESLMLVSAVLAIWTLVPLVVLWCRILQRHLAVAAAVVAFAVPGVWLYSCRAFSGTAATAFLVLALAIWTRPGPNSRCFAGGSVAAGLAVLIRPHFVLAVAVVMVILVVRHPRRWWDVVAPAVILVAAGAAAFIVAAGGLTEVLAGLSEHATQHFDALPTASRNLLESGMARVLVHPAVMLAWLGLTFWGAVGTWDTKEHRDSGVLIGAALIAVFVIVFGFSNPAHPRYAVPLVILSSGFMVTGLRRFLADRWTLVAVAASVCAAAAVTLPVVDTYRRQPSPPLRALDQAVWLAAERGGVVIVDRTMHAFVRYRQAAGPMAAPVIFDHVLELGVAPPPASLAVMVFDGDHDELLISSESRQIYSCGQGLLRRLGQDRFLDVTVADGATLARRSGAAAPLVIID